MRLLTPLLTLLLTAFFGAMPAEAVIAVTNPGIFKMRTAELSGSMIFSSMGGQPVAPTPLIDEISPSAVKVGGAEFELRVRGAGFDAHAVVKWQVDNSITPLDTRFISSAELIARVPRGLIATAQTAAVTVENAGPHTGERASNVLFLPITVPTATVAFSLNEISINTGPMSEAVGDFNGDGKADLAIANTGSNKVTILLGNGDGTFTTAPLLIVGTNPNSLALGDFNGDGKTDLAVTSINLGSGTVSILLGNGDGTFAPANNMPLAFFPSSVAVADFNRDGKLDLAIGSDNTGGIAFLLGNGDGTFTLSPVSLEVGSVPHNPNFLAVGDFNRDGKLDLAVLSMFGVVPPSFYVFLGRGDGTFNAPTSPPIPNGTVSLTIGDFNRDGKLDLAFAYVVDDSTGESDVSVLLGNGDGSFNAGPTSPAGNVFFVTPVPTMMAGDLNGDGKLDLAVPAGTAGTGGSYVILLGKGDGSFAVTDVTTVSGGQNGPAVLADFNADGRLDLATLNDDGGGSVSILLQQPIATLSATSLNFGNHPSTRSVTLTAGAALQIAGITISSNFQLENTYTSCPYNGGTLDPGGRCTIDIRFDPTTTGSVTGVVTITDDSGGVPGSQQTISLTGTGW